jgi:Ni,Fe-hydrogenase maturation factor
MQTESKELRQVEIIKDACDVGLRVGEVRWLESDVAKRLISKGFAKAHHATIHDAETRPHFKDYETR